MLTIDNFREPLREVLIQDHVFNENAQDIFFMEITMKTQSNFVTDVTSVFTPVDSVSPKVNEFIIHIRAFSLTRNVWIKDHMPLSELLGVLKKENFMFGDLRLLYFSMVRDAAILLANKIVFSEEAKTIEIKKKTLIYDIRDITKSKEDLERSKRDHLAELKREQAR